MENLTFNVNPQRNHMPDLSTVFLASLPCNIVNEGSITSEKVKTSKSLMNFISITTMYRTLIDYVKACVQRKLEFIIVFLISPKLLFSLRENIQDKNNEEANSIIYSLRIMFKSYCCNNKYQTRTNSIARARTSRRIEMY